jgi:hypothetical protein
MDRKTFKSKPYHTKTKHNGEVEKVVVPADLDVGAETIPTDLRVHGTARLADIDAPMNSLVFGHRLSVSGSAAVPSANVPSASALYLTPFTSNALCVHNGDHWLVKQTNMVTKSLSALSASNLNYDVFAYYDTTLDVIDLDFSPWSGATTREIALTTLDGVLVKGNDTTRRYVGTVRTVAAGVVADAASRRFVWNYYNRVPRFLQQPSEGTDSWTYAATSYRAANGQTANSFEFVIGDTELVNATVQTLASAGTSGWGCSVGIGVDSTTVNSANIYGTITNASLYQPCIAQYSGTPSAGYHRFTWLEISGGITITFYGDVGNLTYFNFGMMGNVRG